MPPLTELLSPVALSHPSPSLDRWTDKFEQQARLHPGRTALISGAACLSYGELDSRSNQIANHLTSLGIGRGQFVGLGLHRSLDLPVALLGILKSGAAYVPLDPGYPAARISQMITSAKLQYVVTNSTMAGQFREVRTICMDDCAVAAGSIEAPFPSAGNDDPMYAIFTPDSTGQPQAASVYHRGFGNLLHWYSIELSLGPGDRTLVISSPSFDLTQKNFFAPLITGGTLILDDCQSFDISRISGLIRDHGVTLINCTPSAFYPLIDAAAPEGYAPLSSLRFAVLGGESISINRLRAWLEHPACHAEVVNTYGPAECTDICAFHRLHRGNLDDCAVVPPDRKSPGVRLSISDEILAPSQSTKPHAYPVASALSMESRILALWSEILDRPVIDPTANFFDLGGNAIHLAILHVRLMEMTGRIFPITVLFTLPNARSIADFLSPTGAIAATTAAPPPANRTPSGFSRFRLSSHR